MPDRLKSTDKKKSHSFSYDKVTDCIEYNYCKHITQEIDFLQRHFEANLAFSYIHT